MWRFTEIFACARRYRVRLGRPALASLFVGLWITSAPVLWSHEASCALTLTVMNSQSQPIKSTWVELLDSRGNVVLRTMMDGPVLRICDIGFGEHSLRVGVNECFPVTVSRIRVRPPTELSLKVLLNGCDGSLDGSNGCLLYFRAVDSKGKVLPGVQATPAITDVAQVTDTYGRLALLLLKGPSVNLTFSKPGFSSTTVTVTCESPRKIDRMITLEEIQER